MAVFIWKFALIYFFTDVLSCHAKIETKHGIHRHLDQKSSLEHSRLLSKLIPVINKPPVTGSNHPELFPPETEGLTHFILDSEMLKYGNYDNNEFRKKSKDPADENSRKISYSNYKTSTNVRSGKRQKRSISSGNVDKDSFAEMLYTIFKQMEKKQNEFRFEVADKLLKFEKVTNETIRQLKTKFLPRLEEIEERLNISVDCQEKERDRYAMISNISQSSIEDRVITEQELSEWFKIFVYCNFPINEKYGEANETLLHIAAKVNAAETAKLLIDEGADVEAKAAGEITPLHLAARNNAVRVLNLLIANGANVTVRDQWRKTALFYATETDAVEAAQILIDNHANVSDSDYLDHLPVHIAAERNSLKVLKLLIDHHTPLNHKSVSGTALHIAAYKDAVDVARILLDNGANITATNSFAEIPLHSAAIVNSLNVLQLFIQYKAPVNMPTESRYTPLHRAAERNHLAAVKMLVENGADVNCKTYGWITPLHLASDKKAVEVLEYLLANKANASIRDIDNETAFDIARNRNCIECLNVFKKFGIEN